MKLHRSLPFLLLSLAWTAIPALAQSVPTGFQEYFVLGHEQHVWNMLTTVQTAEGGPAFASGTNSVVSATASADNQIITYDHWEDGLEADITSPVQATTLIIGDGNAANGRACDYTTDPRIAPCNGTNDDVLFAGSFVNFNSDQGLGCAAPPNDINCSVPVNPRNPAEIRFDGGDFLVSSGGPLSLIHPQDPLSDFIGGATEIIPRQAVANATAYSIPIGEDIYAGNNSVTEPFKYVEINLVAFDDNTSVNVNSPGAGSVSFTLNRGEHYSSQGLIDGVAAPTITVNSGTRISTTGPLAGLIFTGGDGTFATRFYSLLPDILHGSDYVITAPGDDPTPQGSRPLNLFIFNPDPINALTVTSTDSVGTVLINVPAGASIDYATGTGRFVPANSTVRMTSNRNFWGVSAYSHQSPANDWGHSWLSRQFVTATYTVPFAPGVRNPGFESQPAQRLANDLDCTIPPAGPGLCDSINRVPVFVSALVDNTEVQIDFDNDGVFDVIDIDSDDVPDAAPLPNNTYVIDVLESLRVYDYNDYDNTGTLVLANKPVAVAYGQDTDQATGPDPVQDTGYAVYPINQLFLDPALVLDKSVNSTVVPTSGGIVTYTLTLTTFDFGPFSNVEIFDLLPPGVAGADYVPGSTLITYPDLSQDTTDPTASIDAGTGRDRLDWTLSPNTLQANQTLTVRYSIDIPAAPGGLPRELTNEAHAEARLGSSIFSPVDTQDVVQSDINLTKSVDDLQPEAGDILTFTLNVMNNGISPESDVEVTDPIPSNTTFVPGSITSSLFAGTYDVGQNAVIFTLNPFLPGASDTLTFQVQVNPGVTSGTDIPNQATYQSLETPLFLSNDVESVVVGPALVASKTGPSLLHPNEVTTYEITVDNVGDGTANNVRIVDPFPANVTYVTGSMLWRKNVGAFTAVTDAADADEGTAFVDRLELLVATLGPGEDLTFRFDVQVNPGTDGLFVNNQATVSSDEVTPLSTNLVQAPIAGDADVTGHVFLDVDGNGVQDPGEPDLPNVSVVVTDATGATQTVMTDATGDYLATVSLPCYEDGFTNIAYNGSDGALDWSGVGEEWTEFSAAGLDDLDPTTIPLLVEADPLGVFGDSLLIEGGPAPSNRGFTRQVDLSAAAGFTQGLATLSFNFRRSSMEAADSVQLDIDYDNDGTFNDILQTFPGIGTDATWQSASIVLDMAQLPNNPVVFRFLGLNFNFDNDNFYIDNVRVCNTQVTVNVDESDPDFPAGLTLSTANDPQVLTAVSGGTVAATDVGYTPPPLTFTKTSSAMGEVMPGDTVTYTLTLTNNTSVTQTGVRVTDALPAGTLAVPGSTQVSVMNPPIRVSEYAIAAGTFTGTVFDLALNQPLASDYFVIIEGSDGDGLNDRGPDENYVALTQDPFNTGELATSAGANVIRLERGNAVDSWVGVVKVVECLNDCSGNGFSLVDVRRVDHTGGATTGSELIGATWSSINQVALIGGFNGAGCNTSEAAVGNTKVCHARMFPSGSNQINWTRDPGGATLSTATSTVMAVEWGSAWTVQRVRVQGTVGANGAAVLGAYTTSAISSVARANTWVWGTGHTDDNGIGDAGEAVLITLGDGVNQNGNETTVAVGLENVDTLDFEVYALTHPDLAVDYRFKADGDSANLIVDVAIDAATSNRMALVTNGQNGTGTAYPRPMLSARYLDDTTVRLERRRSGQPFPAWVQGIDFSGLSSTTVAMGNDPANLVVAVDDYTLSPGGVMTVTFDVLVDPNLALAITQIANTASAQTDQQGPENASTTDDVIRLGVTVEPNNAGFAVAGGSVTYTHVVTNTGQESDSYNLTLLSELGYTVELLDPDTGAVIATDTNGDGVWDGGITVNTGTLAAGETAEYRVRVNVPPGTPVGTEESTTLTATSDRDNATSAFATDETTVLETIDIGPVTLLPDQSGVVGPGGSIAYTHSVVNNTGVTDTFDLTAFPTLPGWTATIYNDSNGDGVYSPGIDVAITNTLQLADGQLQNIFVVVTAPVGAVANDTDVVHLTAISQNDPALFDAATDTTTVIPASSHDLSGGGTLLVEQGDLAIFPGTIKNLQDTSDTFDFSVTASPFLGLDGLNHPTRLVIDTDADGVPDTQIAEDADGDGTWDTITAGFDTNGDLRPDFPVAAGGEVAYELRRPVDPMQPSYRDPITLSAQSQNTMEVDSVTSTNLLAAATHAVVSAFEAYVEDGRVIVEWSTASEVGTVGFYLLRRDAQGRVERLPRKRILPGLLHAPQGGTYRFVDAAATPGESYSYQLVEVDVRGAERGFGPYDTVLREREGRGGVGLDEYSKTAHASSRHDFSRDATQNALTKGSGTPSGWLRLPVEATGLAFVSASDLASAFAESESQVRSRIAAGQLRLRREPGFLPSLGACAPTSLGPNEIFFDGFESGDLCAWSELGGGEGIAWLAAPGNDGIYFYAESIDSIYSHRNIYWLGRGPGIRMEERSGGAPDPVSVGTFIETLHLEEERFPLTSVIEDPDSDFWFWQFFLGGDPTQGRRSFPVPTPGAVPGASARLRVHLQGQTDTEDVALDHHVEVRMNGTLLGETRWDGGRDQSVIFEIAPSDIEDGDNTVELTAFLVAGVALDVLYLDSFDLAYTRYFRAVNDMLEATAGGTVSFEGFSESAIEVFDVSDPERPTRLVATTIDAHGGGFRVSFTAPGSGRYLALPLARATTITPEVDLASNLRAADHRGEYVALAGPGLEAAAERLVDHRRRLGFASILVRLQDVYDEFSDGLASPWAIRDFLAHARASWKTPPRFLVLLGDGAFDYEDNLGTGENLVPAPLASTPDGLFPSDHRLADLEGDDGVPEVAVGRVPVRTGVELDAYVTKLIAYETAGGGAWRSRAVWLADDVDEGGEFILDTETLIPLVPPTLDHTRIYVDEVGISGARQGILGALQSGALLVNYLGHGGPDRLANEGLMMTADIGSLNNAERLPVLLALTCSVGRFDFPGFDTLSESLVRHADGGVIALWSPAGLSFNADARTLGDAFLRRAFLPGMTLGEAVQAALAEYLESGEVSGGESKMWLPYVFTLLGDPAIELQP